ncbi:ABC transporter substrate-binding protein [Actinosynnema pretiosum subsp. pretiosum]|uniref:NMT1/THI5 like domain protein n=2 Tax=Actinosynnema TaxID=40566 RepID=C6WQM4_ACTMD|nr:ABC transporter substrate-binding protein [Actinosynnema mirum]ACU38714.1 NMT1/THI5 like domain protein [Actinosynnema mirum DSM 43827]AXX32309.1 Hydroxymethylpyrimidine ABC transporter, substrate-binding component [Actinosynnema pretiosum subsp. pretiosum]QUF03743.1 ABC transporter substrate-binding protein [Actinosynnema pretiosum subsp. pretiosum]
MSSSTLSRRRFGALTAVVATAAALVACSPADAGSSSSSGEGGTKKVTMQIDGSAVPYYAPLYAAQKQGFFKNHGLEVEFTYAQGADIVQNVAAGNVDFGFPNGDSVITAYAKGIKTNVVHTTYQQGIGALLFRDDSGIKTPADLKGRKVGVTDLGSANYAQLQAMLAKENVPLSEVQVETIGTGAIVDAMKNGQVDAIVFSRLRYYALLQAGVGVGQVLSDEYLPSFGNIVIANPEKVNSDAETVKSFNAALNEGIQYVIDNVGEATRMAIKDYAPTFEGQEAQIELILDDVFALTLWQSADTKEHGFGYGNVDRWNESIKAQVGFKLIDKEFDADEMVKNVR